MLKRAQVKVEVQVKIERSIETEPTGGAQGGVALAAAGGSGSMPAPDIGDGPDLSDSRHPPPQFLAVCQLQSAAVGRGERVLWPQGPLYGIFI